MRVWIVGVVCVVILAPVATWFVWPSTDPVKPMTALIAREGDIRFYALVLDEDDRPVSGAKAMISIRSASGGPLAVKPFLTDTAGRITIEGLRGDALSVQSFKKEGYSNPPGRIAPKMGWRFGDKQTHVPDPEKPFVFRLWRNHLPEEPLREFSFWSSLVHDGREYVVDVLKEQTSADPYAEGDFRIAIWNVPDGQDQYGNPRFDWHLTWNGIDGGSIDLAPDDRHMWLAPPDGYIDKRQLSGRTTPGGRLFKQVFFTSRGGQVYGMAILDGTPKIVGKDVASIYFHGVANPNHSRNLQKGPNNVFSGEGALEKINKFSPGSGGGGNGSR